MTKQTKTEQEAPFDAKKARDAEWDEYHKTMSPARAAFETIRVPARAKLDKRLKEIGKASRKAAT